MKKIKLIISKETIKEIESIYKKRDYETVKTVVIDILERYLNIEYFDPKLSIED